MLLKEMKSNFFQFSAFWRSLLLKYNSLIIYSYMPVSRAMHSKVQCKDRVEFYQMWIQGCNVSKYISRMDIIAFRIFRCHWPYTTDSLPD